MTDDEKALLAQVALGWFTVKPDGTIWRNVIFHGGGVSLPTWIKPTRAERSVSKADGYLRVMFNDQGKRRRVAAHRVSWMVANRQDIPPTMEINHEHQDGNKQRNDPRNLSLVTRRENVVHAIRVLKRKPKAQNGEKNAMAKVTEAQVAEIRSLVAAKSLPQREIGKMYGITQSAVSAIVTGKSWPL
jgi:hypothetical protein